MRSQLAQPWVHRGRSNMSASAWGSWETLAQIFKMIYLFFGVVFVMFAFVLLEAPKTPKKSSRSKVGLEVGFGGVPESRSKVGQKYTKSYIFDLLLTYFQGPPRNLLPDLLLTYLNFLGFSGPVGGQRQHKVLVVNHKEASLQKLQLPIQSYLDIPFHERTQSAAAGTCVRISCVGAVAHLELNFCLDCETAAKSIQIGHFSWWD